MPKCGKCGIWECFKALTRKDEWITMDVCHNCRFDVSRNYVSDVVVKEFIDSKFVKAPKCSECDGKCFLKLGNGGYYFTEQCQSCIEFI